MGGKKRIRVKFVNRAQLSSAPIQWLRQFPNRKPVWGNCEFIFDPNEPNYDWFVAENDLPAPAGKPQAFATETLRCPAEHTFIYDTRTVLGDDLRKSISRAVRSCSNRPRGLGDQTSG